MRTHPLNLALRFLLELAALAGYARILGVLVVIHYAVSYERIHWLLSQ